VDRVLVLFGGVSAEHPVSCLSARSVLSAIDRRRHEVVAVGITADGTWTLGEAMLASDDGRALPIVDATAPAVELVVTERGPEVVPIERTESTPGSGRIDVAFPVLHGVGGEDGTIQAMLAAAGVRCVGADATASRTGMHKAEMKAAFARADLPQIDHVVVTAAEWDTDPASVDARVGALALPWFTKPARQGSSIGITRVLDPDALAAALAVAFAHDDTVVVEEGLVSVRELEVGVLEGQDGVRVSAPGEIVPAHDFYDFEAKYLDASELVVPAVLDADVAAACRRMAREAFDAIGCRGMARVDLFLADDGRLLVNEINTIPGFTDRSMFPRLWQAEGVDYPTLIDILLDGAKV